MAHDTGAKLESAGKQISSCGGSLVKLGCSGFLALFAILIAVAVLSSGHSGSTPATTATTQEHATGTAPTAAEAPTLDRNAAEDDAAHECGHGTSGNPHTSCAFAEKVR